MGRVAVGRAGQVNAPRPGRVEERTLAGDPAQIYFLYVPSGVGEGAPLFVSMHGASRRAAEHATLLAPFAEQAGAVLVAPLFPRERFPDYHCLGREGRGERADYALERILDEVAEITAARHDALYLSGYSGGGQFVHRYTMAYPERVARVVAGAPGWWTFPEQDRDYPFGIRPPADLPSVSFDPARFVRVPCLVVVGEGDVQRDEQLNQEPEVDAQQGRHRVERAERWTTAMRAAATIAGYDNPYPLEILPGVGHSFSECVTRGGLGGIISAFLFGKLGPRGEGRD